MSYVTAAGSGRKPLATEFVFKENWNSLNLAFHVVDIVWHKDHWYEYYFTIPSKQTKKEANNTWDLLTPYVVFPSNCSGVLPGQC